MTGRFTRSRTDLLPWYWLPPLSELTLRYSLLKTSTEMAVPEMTMAAGLALNAFLRMATKD